MRADVDEWDFVYTSCGYESQVWICGKNGWHGSIVASTSTSLREGLGFNLQSHRSLSVLSSPVFSLSRGCLRVLQIPPPLKIDMQWQNRMWTIWNVHVTVWIGHKLWSDLHLSHKYRKTQCAHTHNYDISCFYWRHLLNTHSAAGKSKGTLKLITGWTSFGSKNLKHVFLVAADQTCTISKGFTYFFLPL